jgi:hypothetical protein
MAVQTAVLSIISKKRRKLRSSENAGTWFEAIGRGRGSLRRYHPHDDDGRRKHVVDRDRRARTQGKAFPFLGADAGPRYVALAFAWAKEVCRKIVDHFGSLGALSETPLLLEVDGWDQMDKLVFGVE